MVAYYSVEKEKQEYNSSVGHYSGVVDHRPLLKI